VTVTLELLTALLEYFYTFSRNAQSADFPTIKADLSPQNASTILLLCWKLFYDNYHIPNAEITISNPTVGG